MTFEEKIKQYHVDKEYSVGVLTSQEEEFISKEYSASVEDIRLISKSQAWLLENEGVTSPNFTIQTLLKIRGLIDINKIRANMIGLVQNNELLRSAFLLSSNERNLQIILHDRIPEMTFIDFSKDKLPEFEIDEIIENVLAADRRRYFDLKRDRLIRIRVAKFGLSDYAISIQQPQIISDGWDIRHLFDGVFSEQETDDVLAQMIAPKKYSFAQYLERRKESDIIRMLDYWQKRLMNFPDSNFPGYQKNDLFETNSLVAEFDDKMSSYMKSYLENTDNSIVLLETAWGIMLQKYNNDNDAVYPILLSNYREAKEDNIDFASVISLIPTRFNESNNSVISDVLKRQQASLSLGRAYSGCTIKELEQIFPNKKIFNHILNFHSFHKQQKYSKAEVALGVNVVKINSYDSYNNDLVVIFRHGNKVKVEFIYNKYAFTETHIKKIKEDYFFVVNQILKDSNKMIGEIKLPESDFDFVKQEADFKLSITQLLRTKSIFNSLDDRELDILVRGIIIKNFIYGDIILSEGEKQDFIYLIYDGIVELRRTTESGWTVKIANVEKGEFISYDGIFNTKDSSIRARVVSKDATIIAIRNDVAQEGIKNNFNFAKDIVKSITEQVDKFQKLWVENKA